MSEFFNMGGYAWFVWPSYLITLVVLAANVWLSARQYQGARRKATRRLAQRQQESNS